MGQRLQKVVAATPLPEEVLISIAGGLLLQRILPWRLAGPVWPLVGWPLSTGAAAFYARAWAVRGFGSDLEHPESLITTGPYAVSRHPLYVGALLIQVGVGCLSRTGWVLAAWPWVARRAHAWVMLEEDELAGQFGDEWTEYAGRVPRWV